jgi:hypothetical protein
MARSELWSLFQRSKILASAAACPPPADRFFSNPDPYLGHHCPATD